MTARKGHISIETLKTVFIAGAGKGIGLALVENLLENNPSLKVYATYRTKKTSTALFSLQKRLKTRLFVYQLHGVKQYGEARPIERSSEEFGEEFGEEFSECQWIDMVNVFLKDVVEIDLFINCIGFLSGSGRVPEKKLADINIDYLLESFCSNSLPVVLFAKHLFSFFKNKSPSAFISLSARVGSISDNSLGGWYGYRASKAANNMFVKNIALEFSRLNLNTLVMSLHPGTTDTDLSKNFIKNTKYQVHSPNQTAKNMIEVIEKKTLDDHGGFFDWRGEEILW